MRLEMDLFKIENVITADRTYIQDHILFVNSDELRKVISEDSRFSSVEIELSHPGDNTRIINVLDVIEPRIKVKGGESFPGWAGSMGIAGTGKTNALKGVSVMEVGIKRPFAGAILDMDGPGSEVANFSKLHHVILVTNPASGVSEAEYGHALKMAGLKAAQYLAGASVSLQPDESRIYDSGHSMGPSDKIRLPRIAYVYITECHFP